MLSLASRTLARTSSLKSSPYRKQKHYCTTTKEAEKPVATAAQEGAHSVAQPLTSVTKPKILLTTGSVLYGRKIVQEIALVSGSSVRARNFFFDILSRVSGFFGWEVTFYSTLIAETTSQSTERMINEAEKLKADAIINVKVTMSSTSDPTAGVFVYAMTYGTAVITEAHHKGDPVPQDNPLTSPPNPSL